MGVSTIDECVLSGVPTLVYCGWETDMAGTTARVVHHGIGIAGDRQRDTTTDIRAHVDRLLSEPGFRERVRRLQGLYAAYAENRVAERAVDALLERPMNGDGIGTIGESGPRRAAPVTETTRRFATGAGWLYAYRWLERLLDFLAIVVLARLLAPDDFGLVAIAASFVTIVEGLSAFDVDKALIRSRDDDRALYDTAWTLSALRGLLAALAMWTIAPWVADARMAAVLRVLALGPILNGLRNPRFVTFERDLVYSRLAVLTIAAKVVSVGAMLVLAVAYRSYWALVLGQLAYALTGTILSYLLQPYRPRISLARFSTLFGFSGWLTLTSVVTVLSMETDKLIVGWLVGVTDAGLYFMTQRVGVLPTQELLSPLQRILFPAFSELAGDRPGCGARSASRSTCSPA